MYRKLRSGRLVITDYGWKVMHTAMFAVMVFGLILIINTVWNGYVADQIATICK